MPEVMTDDWSYSTFHGWRIAMSLENEFFGVILAEDWFASVGIAWQHKKTDMCNK